MKRKFVLLYGRASDESSAFRHAMYGEALPRHLVRRRDAKLGCEVIAQRGSPKGDMRSVVGCWTLTKNLEATRLNNEISKPE